MLGTQTMIVLSSPKTVKDLMHSRSAIYSSRPEMYLAHNVVGESQRFVTMVGALKLLRYQEGVRMLIALRNMVPCGD